MGTRSRKMEKTGGSPRKECEGGPRCQDRMEEGVDKVALIIVITRINQKPVHFALGQQESTGPYRLPTTENSQV